MSTQSTLMVSGRVDTNVYDEEQLPADWDSLSDSEKMNRLDDVEPSESYTTHNTTVDGMHTYFARNLNPNDSINLGATHLAVGNDDATNPSTTDTSLNNEVFRTSASSYTQSGSDLTVSTFIDSSEANGYTLKELGLFAGSGSGDRMWNHSLIANIAKDDSRTITFDVTLTFTAA